MNSLPAEDHPRPQSLTDLYFSFSVLALQGFGGVLTVVQRELVEKKRWIGQTRFLHALNFCMLLPGPEAQQLTIYIGWLLHRTLGGLVAGTLFVLPSIVILWTLSFGYSAFGGALALACLMLPVVIGATEQMLKLVSKSFYNELVHYGVNGWCCCAQLG